MGVARWGRSFCFGRERVLLAVLEVSETRTKWQSRFPRQQPTSSCCQFTRCVLPHGLHAKPAEAKKFYIAITVFTIIAMCINFFGINPIKALVYAGIVQGFSTPFLMRLIMLITN